MNLSKKITLIFAIAYVSANFGMGTEPSFDSLLTESQQLALTLAHVTANKALLLKQSTAEQETIYNYHISILQEKSQKVEKLLNALKQNSSNKKISILTSIEKNLKKAKELLN